MNPKFDIYTNEFNRDYIKFLRQERLRLNVYGQFV